jgi:dTDP-4-dehydrorhamnose 3,5-epimerase
MIFTETSLKGAFVIDPEPIRDERGMFARTWCRKEFDAKGLKATWVQNNISVSIQKGTLRGMHYQLAPHEEAKLVQCTMGALYDVIVDLRPASATYCQYFGVVLSAENRRMLFIPETFAHGYLTLQDQTEVFYHMSEFHVPASASGFRWDDSLFHIEWPEPITAIAGKDRNWPAFKPDRRLSHAQ